MHLGLQWLLHIINFKNVAFVDIKEMDYDMQYYKYGKHLFSALLICLHCG